MTDKASIKKTLNFFVEAGKLKGMPRRGWVIRGIKDPESIAEHTFRVALMVWVLSEMKKENLNIERVVKMALIHDLCEVYAGDATPYDSILPADKKARQEMLKSWPRFSKKERERINKKKFTKEKKALQKIVSKLPSELGKEVKNLWLDYEKGLSREGRFFRQTDRLESFLQAIEYWKKYKKMPQGSWWIQARELFDDPILLFFVDAIDNEFHKDEKPKN